MDMLRLIEAEEADGQPGEDWQMRRATARGRRFLFLQGPHGPFFGQLARLVAHAGADVLRVGFNAGDAAFWPSLLPYTPFTDPPEAWADACGMLMARDGITDLVVYGDTRPVHRAAVVAARAAGVRVHCFEEGYLRPYWATYERGGVNGHSRLMALDIPGMRSRLADAGAELTELPARWGDLRQHIGWGAAYHARVLLANRRYRGFRPHREISVARELDLYLRRLAALPLHGLMRWNARRRLGRGGNPYHVALLQLAHDASFRAHGAFPTMADFLETVIAGFAEGAPGHHMLVLKAHPLEDGREPLPRLAAHIARAHGVEGRVLYVPGGKLAALLDQARSALTVNSTSAQQALWRGLPVRLFGTSVYDKPELVSRQPLVDFFAEPKVPDMEAYRVYRHFLLATSQIPGGFYSRRARSRLLRRAPDLMLAEADPYEMLEQSSGTELQHLRLAT